MTWKLGCCLFGEGCREWSLPSGETLPGREQGELPPRPPPCPPYPLLPRLTSRRLPPAQNKNREAYSLTNVIQLIAVQVGPIYVFKITNLWDSPFKFFLLNEIYSDSAKGNKCSPPLSFSKYVTYYVTRENMHLKMSYK